MRLFLTLLGLCLPLVTQAFLAAPQSVVRTDQQVLIESWENQADVTVTETWKNETAQTQNLELILPTVGVSTLPQVFWQSEGQTLSRRELNKAAERVYDLARQHQQSAWLGALDNRFDVWWHIENLTLNPGESTTLKYQYTQTLQSAEDFKVGTLFLTDGRVSEQLDVRLVRAGTPEYWWASQGQWASEKSDEAWAQRWQENNFTFTKNLHYFTSDNPEAELSYNYAGKGYQAQFKKPIKPDFARVVLLLDRSGSVYGARWERLQQATKTLLEKMPASTQLKVGLMGPELEWLDEDWTANTRKNQKQWLGTLAGTNVQGKSNWSEVTAELKPLGENADARVVLVLLGDFKDFPLESHAALAAQDWKVMMVDFWQAESSALKTWWQRWGGEYVRLFNSGYELAEADLLHGAWSRLGLRWPEDQAIETNTESFAPRTFERSHNQRSLSQGQPLQASTNAAAFLPHWWASRKLAHYLRASLEEDLSEEKVAAINSISDLFGVERPNLESDAPTKWAQIEALEAGGLSSDSIRSWGAEPFYAQQNTWRTRRWDNAQPRGDRPELALWSEAHRALFLAEPQLLAVPLSWGLVDVCAGQRCGSVTQQGREAPAVTDTLLWSNQNPHWALDAWATLVWAGVIENPELNHEVWAEPISRGEFAEYLVAYLSPDAILPAIDSAPFLDLTAEQVGGPQALWLHQQGLFKGYGDQTARLNQPLKRIEALKLLMTARGLGVRDVLGNYDAKAPLKDLEGWTQPWGMEAYLRGLVRGYDDGTLRPFQDLTQAEAFKLLVESEKLLE